MDLPQKSHQLSNEFTSQTVSEKTMSNLFGDDKLSKIESQMFHTEKKEDDFVAMLLTIEGTSPGRELWKFFFELVFFTSACFFLFLSH
jgi:hypothetical protein